MTRGFKQTEIGKIPEDWQIKSLGDCIELVYGEGLPERKRENGTIPVFGSNGVIGFHNKFLVKGPGIIVGRKESVGEVTYSKDNFWPIDTTYYVQVKDGNDINFCFYFLKTLELTQMNSHSAVPGLNRDNVYDIIKPIPKLEEQKAIAKILSDLDEKIELNRQMNKTLESIAQAIFKRWFVDFEFPNEEGKPYKLTGGNMIESEPGEIPESWKIGTVVEDFNLTMGQSPPGETYNEIGDGIAFFQGCADFGYRFPVERVYCTAPTRYANPGDTLVTVRAPVGDVNMAFQKCCIGRGLAAIRHKSGSRSFTYYAMQMLRQTFDNYEAEGTVFGSMGKEDFNLINVVIPSLSIVQEFEKWVYAIDQLIEENEKSTRVLASVRDSLLPKLIGGIIKVKN